VQPLLDIDEFFGGDGEKYQIAGEGWSLAPISDNPIATPSMPATWAWALWAQAVRRSGLRLASG
jgi:hypothetical protein